jgi:hypothetical protein
MATPSGPSSRSPCSGGEPQGKKGQGRNLTVLAVFLLAIGAVASMTWLRPDRRPRVEMRPPLKPSGADEFRGISMQLWSGSRTNPYKKYIRQIADTGANTLSLVPHGYQENATSSSVFPDARHTPDEAHFVELIRYARSLDLRVVLMPIVLLENPRSGEWRGKIKPDDWEHWWQSYTDFILRYARIAQKGQADVLIVGSELVRTESKETQWRRLIRKVRKVYGGRLSYSANWDHYRQIAWWDAVDIVGLTTYFDLTDKGKNPPTLENLTAAWEDIREDICTWQKRVNRRILFTEVGWPSQATAAQQPWNYFGAEDQPDPQLQARCFEAFFRTWFHRPEMTGYLIWEWRNNRTQEIHQPEKLAGDVSYIPAGKPAIDVIRKYNAMPPPHPPASRPATQPEDK